MITDLLLAKFPESEKEWLTTQVDKIQNSDSPRAFQIAFGMVPRKVSAQVSQLSNAELEVLEKTHPYFSELHWTSQDFARLVFIMNLSVDKEHTILENVFQAADNKESRLLYRSLCFYKNPQAFIWRAAEGIRTNIQVVYDAIALNNPYPSAYFNNQQWNQMVLKAIFMGRPLFRIKGIDQRNNEELTGMAINYIKERWAASRDVSPEIWRLIAPFDHLLEKNLLEKLQAKESPLENLAHSIITGSTNENWDILGKKYATYEDN